jgi:hypothetical protein
MKKNSYVMGCAGVLVVLALLSFVCRRAVQREEAEKRQAEEAAGPAVAAAVARLQAASSSFQAPGPDAQDVACAMPVRGGMLRLTAADLAQFGPNGAVRKPGLPEQPFSSHEIHTIVTNAKSVGGKEAADKINAAQFFLVYVPVAFRAPVLLEGSESYKGGHFDGFVVATDAATGKPVCRARFQARSSEKVEGTEKMKDTRAGWSFKDKIMLDFRDNLHKAADVALARINAK